ncbi:MAG: DUF3383 domain-containing protein [Lachnospiraceae bacterium]|nr:DUF3383 domain-containing protein [Lachnospiraceae bacterium]
MKDVVVSVRVDDKPEVMNELEILLVSTDDRKDSSTGTEESASTDTEESVSTGTKRAAKTYTDLSDIKNDWGENSKVYKMASALFNQGNAQPAPEKLIRKVTVAGFGKVDTPDDLVKKLKEYAEKNNDWYIFLTDRTEDEYIMKLSEFAQSSEPAEAGLASGEEDHRKIYFAKTSKKNIADIKGRSVIVYTEKEDEHIEAAYLGAVAPWYPKHVTWKFKMPQGLTVPTLTASEISTLDKNHINYVSDEYKNNYIKNGVCADGEWIDSLLGNDWIAKDMRNELYKVFMENAVIPYTDDGFNLIGMAVFRTLNRAVQYGIIASDSDSGTGVYRVSIPARSTATEEQIRNRIMPDITWEAQLEGAVHGIRTKGVLKVNL